MQFLFFQITMVSGPVCDPKVGSNKFLVTNIKDIDTAIAININKLLS